MLQSSSVIRYNLHDEKFATAHSNTPLNLLPGTQDVMWVKHLIQQQIQHPSSVRVYASCNYLTGLVKTGTIPWLTAPEFPFTCPNWIPILSALPQLQISGAILFYFTSTEKDRGRSLWAQMLQTSHIPAVILIIPSLAPKTLKPGHTLAL